MRVLIGRGPVEWELNPEFLLWFEHGELDYPTFQSPSVGPSGAALKLSSKPVRLVVNETDALALIEVSAVIPVPPGFPAEFDAAPPEQTDAGPVAAIDNWVRDTRTCLEQAVGLYALYQYPIVWEPLGVHPVVGFVDTDSRTFRLSTRIKPDNFIPFRLDASARVKDGHLLDAGLAELHRLNGSDFHLPLILLQRALWQRNIQLRFLETFLLLDYLTGRSKVQDTSRSERKRQYDAIEKSVLHDCPEHESRIKALKHVILQAPLRERFHAYLRHLGISVDETVLGKMLAVRNDIASARPVDESVLISMELQRVRLREKHFAENLPIKE